MVYKQPVYRFSGDRALLVELGDSTDWAITRRVHVLNRLLRERATPGVIETVPAFRNLLILFDPFTISHPALQAIVDEAVHGIGEVPDAPSRLMTIPAAFGGPLGPDLEDVARHTGFPPEEVIRRVLAAEFRVHFMGFSPGNAYIGGVPHPLVTPRKMSPRLQVPAGSVGIGGEQFAIYPMEMPGGFQLIGRTPVRVWDPRRETPSLLRTGDRLRFRRIDSREYEVISRSVEAGTYGDPI